MSTVSSTPSPGRRHARHPVVDNEVSKRLLVRPRRGDGEHPGGHWLRLAHRNGLRDPRWLLDVESPRAHSMVRVCPKCLARPSAFWPTAWFDASRPWCAEHRCWLVDRCVGCAKPLHWGSTTLLHCRCGQALSDIAAPEVSPQALRALGDENVPPSVLMWLGALARYGLADKPVKRASRRTMRDAIDQIQLGAMMIADWPSTFFGTLDACRGEPGGVASLRLLNEALPGLNKRIGKVRDPAWRERISIALADYVQATGNTTTPLVGRNVPGPRPPTVKGMARALGVRTERLTAVLDRQLKGEVIMRGTPSGRCRRFVSTGAIAAAQRSLNDDLTIKAAARRLGITAARVRQLVADGILPPNFKRVSRAEVTALLRSLQARVIETPVPRGAVELSRAMRYGVPVAQTGRLIEAILAGELAVHGALQRDRVVRTFVDSEQVRTALRTAKVAERHWVTIPECAKRMKLKQQVVYHLTRIGLIATQRTHTGHRIAQTVSLAALKDFEENFEPLAVAAVRTGMDPRRGLEWARSKGMELVSGPRVDGGRKYFVRRTL